MRPLVLLRLAHAMQNRTGLPFTACLFRLAKTAEEIDLMARRVFDIQEAAQ